MTVLASLAHAEISADSIQGYLDQLGLQYERAQDEFLIVVEDPDGEHWPVMYIIVQADIEACYLAALPGVGIPLSGQERFDALETVLELNWNSLFGKFEISPETGEISISYVFSTENGLGFEAFEAVMAVLFTTMDENMEVLATFAE